jgi:hypothetical protein
MIKIGDICPVFFNPLKYQFSRDIDYVQKFHSSDHILLQIFADDRETVSGVLHDLVRESTVSINFSSYDVNEYTKMYYCVLLLEGYGDSTYSLSLSFSTGENLKSEPFMVCSSSDLLNVTSLIRFSHKDNNSPFDNIFWIEDQQQVFDFRLEAGFKPSGISFNVSNEQFRNQFQEIEELYSIPYKNMILQCGDSVGLPYWYAEFINKILCLSKFDVNGIGYVRSEGNVPEMSQLYEDGQMFHFSIRLEPRINDILGIGGRPESATGSSVVGFIIDNPKDGEMLQYKGSKAAFVNVDNVGV